MIESAGIIVLCGYTALTGILLYNSKDIIMTRELMEQVSLIS